ncbi:PAS domain S-box protein [Burkholderia sp. L27(2015)]|uniref:hybrid sensor histidine kinase/response regulator n=1 Tax=Burkholderia sp. L27(2015) TaxID=1641858 RepID=UPI00131C7DCB|nr:PAS domain S-box protein [Burkholderia sp. L27(2015)]
MTERTLPQDLSGYRHYRWLEHVTDYAIIVLTPDGMIESWNSGAERIKGYRADEIIGRHFSVFYVEDDQRQGLPGQVLKAALQNGRHDTEGWRVRKDGTLFWASVVITAIYDAQGKLAGFGKIVRDISDKRAAHEAVKESERRFRLLVQGVIDYAIYMLSPEGYVTNWNVGAARIKGYNAEEVIGTHFSRFYTQEDADAGLPMRGLAIAKREGKHETEGWRVRGDGTQFFAHVVIDAIYDDDGSLVGFAKITRDMSEQRLANERLKKAESALFQSQKMEAIGKLTGGVAHDFNNVLQVLRGNLELLESRHARDEWSRERLDKAIEAVERGATLSAQLLAFGRRQALQPLVVNLAGLLRSMDDLLRRALGETIAVETVVSGGLWNTQVDPHQLENVVLNLAINARDAMKNGGQLTLELANAMLDDQYVATQTDVPSGQYVMLAVTDTGTGMPANVAAQAFEPFFTTKPEGEGTGLGLSMAYGFIKQSGGHIKLYSEIGHGTTVKIYLPRSMEAAVEPAARQGAVLVGGSEAILVVEDDPKVQSTVVDTLSQLGYAVLKADDAQGALTIIRSGVHIDLLFTDVVMPGPVRSPEMAKQALALLPHLRVLFTSGYTQNAIVHGGRLDPGVELLSKPYSREQLAYKVRQMLRGATSPANVRRQDKVAEAQPTTVSSATSLRILVVEDHDDSREAICEVLTMLGHRPHGVGSGEEALANLGAQTFEVLLTDISLPGMSGIELAHKATDVTPALRCVFASGRDLPHDANFPFEWLALRKPYTGEQIQAILSKLCSGE